VAPALSELAGQLDVGRIYDRDLPALTAALEEVLVARMFGGPQAGPG